MVITSTIDREGQGKTESYPSLLLSHSPCLPIQRKEFPPTRSITSVNKPEALPDRLFGLQRSLQRGISTVTSGAK